METVQDILKAIQPHIDKAVAENDIDALTEIQNLVKEVVINCTDLCLRNETSIGGRRKISKRIGELYE